MTRALIEQYVRAGEARGVTTVCITEHLFRFEEAYKMLHGWWDEDPDKRLAGMVGQYWQDHVSGSVADYVRLIEDAKSAGLPVLLGIEMDWLHGKEDVLRSFLAPYDWDIVLGSVHYIGSWGIDDDLFLDEWEKRDVAQAWAEYGGLMKELAEMTGGELFTPKTFKDLAPIYEGLLDELAAQYVIGYIPQGDLAPGEHRLRVEVPGAGTKVRHRRGFRVAPPEKNEKK